jgi:hypothetical protein
MSLVAGFLWLLRTIESFVEKRIIFIKCLMRSTFLETVFFSEKPDIYRQSSSSEGHTKRT